MTIIPQMMVIPQMMTRHSHGPSMVIPMAHPWLIHMVIPMVHPPDISSFRVLPPDSSA